MSTGDHFPSSPSNNLFGKFPNPKNLKIVNYKSEVSFKLSESWKSLFAFCETKQKRKDSC